MEPTVSIGSVIARERRLRGDTQQELAERLGVSKAAVSKWEVGQSIPDVTLLPRIAAYFSLTLDELFGYRSVLSNEEVATLYAELRAKAARDQSSALDRLREAVQDHYADCRLLVMMASLLFEWATVGPDPLGQAGDEVPRLAAEDGPDMLMAEAVDLLDHVIDEGSDSVAVRQAAQMKAATLVQSGSYAKAVALLEPVVSPQGISQVMLLVTARGRPGSLCGLSAPGHDGVAALRVGDRGAGPTRAGGG
ncbi:helix-turn-helix domain-containing protein [Olsenella uli]|uniref:helix-turn-helix domain-containing protein n=1 Tax=Olsenella uli TaxID=133926 RepID=UPI0028F0EEB8|nr:helix-turn-helix domain-containing protein [Olsenella uli]